jgi:hypothetical protein
VSLHRGERWQIFKGIAFFAAQNENSLNDLFLKVTKNTEDVNEIDTQKSCVHKEFKLCKKV